MWQDKKSLQKGQDDNRIRRTPMAKCKVSGRTLVSLVLTSIVLRV